jgi:hypothetical protein
MVKEPPPAMENPEMFSTAKKVAAVTPPAPKGKATPNAVDAIPGYAAVAALDVCIKQLVALLELKKDPVKGTVSDRLLKRGMATKTKPATMYPADGSSAGGSVSLTRRASNRPLAENEIEVLADLFEISIGDNGGLTIPGITETREKQPALLAVNPAYAGDEILLARIDKALQGVKGVPEDFIIQQDPVIETIVSETALDRIWSHPANVVTGSIAILAGLVFRPVFKDMMKAWEMVIEMLGEANATPTARKRAS